MSEQNVRGHLIRIEDGNLVIRSARLEDAKTLNAWWNDGRVMAHAGFPNGLNEPLEVTQAIIMENEESLSQRCIVEADNIRIGEMSYDIEAGCAEIGIKICEQEYQNKGLGTRLLQMLIEFLFTDKDINNSERIEKIILDTNLNNVRAQHVYEKLGFTRLRVNYDAWKDQLGEWQSAVDYELTRDAYDNGVRWISGARLKEHIAETILSDLPEWFGIPESTREYIENSRTMPFFACVKNGEYAGFIVLKETSQYTAEIYVMGVLKKYHRTGIGRMLFESFTAYAKSKGYKFLQVKTVDGGHYAEYDRTRLFYEKMGFKKLECFPTLWDEHNPCLVMVQVVDSEVVPLKGHEELAGNTVSLSEIKDEDFRELFHLSVADEQKKFVPSTEGILARAWMHRNENARVYAINAENKKVGLMLIYELDEEPVCYCLMEMMVDKGCQNKGYGSEALRLLIKHYGNEPKYPMIELSVDRTNEAAIHTYEKAGFVDSGYVDEALPQYINMVYRF